MHSLLVPMKSRISCGCCSCGDKGGGRHAPSRPWRRCQSQWPRRGEQYLTLHLKDQTYQRWQPFAVLRCSLRYNMVKYCGKSVQLLPSGQLFAQNIGHDSFSFDVDIQNQPFSTTPWSSPFSNVQAWRESMQSRHGHVLFLMRTSGRTLLSTTSNNFNVGDSNLLLHAAVSYEYVQFYFICRNYLVHILQIKLRLEIKLSTTTESK